MVVGARLAELRRLCSLEKPRNAEVHDLGAHDRVSDPTLDTGSKPA
jgi:hypothetical protein